MSKGIATDFFVHTNVRLEIFFGADELNVLTQNTDGFGFFDFEISGFEQREPTIGEHWRHVPDFPPLSHHVYDVLFGKFPILNVTHVSQQSYSVEWSEKDVIQIVQSD